MNDNRPIILYVDDEPNNITVFESAMPHEWNIKGFSHAAEALSLLDTIQPWVILCDQRMPSMTGVQFLEISQKLVPHAIRMIVTGYADENSVIDSVRRAKVFDYISKPWDNDQLEASIVKAIEMYSSAAQARQLTLQLQKREQELHIQTEQLKKMALKLQETLVSEEKLRQELQCWVSPLVLWALQDTAFQFPIHKDLIGIVFDIINSSGLHGVNFEGRNVRSIVLQLYSESILRHGGWRESTSGDSAFGHFGLIVEQTFPAEAALAAAKDFRSALQNFKIASSIEVHCGIGLHKATNCIVDIHTTHLMTHKGPVTQKAFETISPDIDLLHRIEKAVHRLPGTNIIMTSHFIDCLKEKPKDLYLLGKKHFKGQIATPDLWILKDDLVEIEELENFLKSA